MDEMEQILERYHERVTITPRLYVTNGTCHKCLDKWDNYIYLHESPEIEGKTHWNKIVMKY